MSKDKQLKEAGVGSIIEFQTPLIKSKSEELNESMIKYCMPLLKENDILRLKNHIKNKETAFIRNIMYECLIRKFVRLKLQEIIRKKGEGYALYAPNKKGFNKPKIVGTFPTLLGAKVAQLARFPPKQINLLNKLRHDIEKLKLFKKKNKFYKDTHTKKDDYVANKVLSDKPIKKKKSKKNESNKKDFMEKKIISIILKKNLHESVLLEEPDIFNMLPLKILDNDGKLKKYKKEIEKKSKDVLNNAFLTIRKNVNSKVKLESEGIKQDTGGNYYFSFNAILDNVSIGPININIVNDIPIIDLTSDAKAALTKIKPESAKIFRADLMITQEKVLDNIKDLYDVVTNRNKYLKNLEDKIDKYIVSLSPVELSLIKNLLKRKYRKI